LLKQNGADINEQDGTGRTAMHLAVASHDDAIQSFLIESRPKPDLSLADYNGSTAAVHTGAGGNKVENLHRLLEAGAFAGPNNSDLRSSPLHSSASRGHMESVKMLLKQPGVDINATDGKNRTASH
ncbi:ankyrin repeat-containing domain protein, partial [Massariosphaeria phaeospora]